MKWQSTYEDAGRITLPPFNGIRVLLMPFHVHDPANTLPPLLQRWGVAITSMLATVKAGHGVGYVTIDEMEVAAGRPHRRPGLHVDGWHDEGQPEGAIGGSWGMGGGWGSTGLIVAASHEGCVVYDQEFEGQPAIYGDCANLAGQLKAGVQMLPNRIYKMTGLTVHESVALPIPVRRQFVRVSMPSNAGWPISCTPNPLGIQPGGPLLPPRPTGFTEFRI